VVNFFTSFGYFDNDADHYRSLVNIRKGLKPKGLLLLDYFNSDWIRSNIIPAETKIIDGIEFHATKWTDKEHVFKKVTFEINGQEYAFQERVRLFSLIDFKMLMEQSGLTIKAIFGDYELSAFDPIQSKRMIIIAEKS
jgi:hypothetical protein